MKLRNLCRMIALASLGAGVATAAPAAVITYEWTEGGAGQGVLSSHVSRHGVRGPVLADDFKPIFSGLVTRVDWWGAAPMPGAPTPDLWEVTFHTDAGGVPAATAPTGGVSQHFVNDNGTDMDGDGVFLFSASWTPRDLFVNAGQTYWFSVANAQCSQISAAGGPACLVGWNWANAGGAAPSIGSEMFTAVNSFGVGPNGGPHFGPWNALASNAQNAKQDFAFRIWVDVPEPATLFAFGAGLVGAAAMARRRRRPRST